MIFTVFHYSVHQRPESRTLTVPLTAIGMKSLTECQERGGDYFVLSQNKHQFAIPA